MKRWKLLHAEEFLLHVIDSFIIGFIPGIELFEKLIASDRLIWNYLHTSAVVVVVAAAAAVVVVVLMMLPIFRPAETIWNIQSEWMEEEANSNKNQERKKDGQRNR